MFLLQKAESEKTLDFSDSDDLKKSPHVYTNPVAQKTMDWNLPYHIPVVYESVV